MYINFKYLKINLNFFIIITNCLFIFHLFIFLMILFYNYKNLSNFSIFATNFLSFFSNFLLIKFYQYHFQKLFILLIIHHLISLNFYQKCNYRVLCFFWINLNQNLFFLYLINLYWYFQIYYFLLNMFEYVYYNFFLKRFIKYHFKKFFNYLSNFFQFLIFM